MELDSQKYEDFSVQIKAYISTYWKLYIRYSYINTGLILCGLLISAGVTITGFMELEKWPGILGVLISLLLGIQNAFNYGGRAAFLHVVHDEAKVLRDRLKYKVRTKEEFEDVIDAFIVLRMNAVNNLPRGEGMNAVKDSTIEH